MILNIVGDKLIISVLKPETVTLYLDISQLWTDCHGHGQQCLNWMKYVFFKNTGCSSVTDEYQFRFIRKHQHSIGQRYCNIGY